MPESAAPKAPRRHGRYRVSSDRPPTLDEIRAARETLSRLLSMLESGKWVLVPQSHFAELDRLRSRLPVDSRDG